MPGVTSHPEDREAAWALREATLNHGEPFTFLHRIVSAANRERFVIAARHLFPAGDEEAVVHGSLIDLTEVPGDVVAEEVDTAVLDFASRRTVIKQAKGVLVQLYSVDADTAFAVLRAFSMNSNMKIHDVASTPVDAASRNDTPTKGKSPSAHLMLNHLYADPAGDAWSADSSAQ